MDAVRDSASEIEVELNSDETNLLATISKGPIHHRQEDSQAVRITGVIHAMKWQDNEVC